MSLYAIQESNDILDIQEHYEAKLRELAEAGQSVYWIREGEPRKIPYQVMRDSLAHLDDSRLIRQRDAHIKEDYLHGGLIFWEQTRPIIDEALHARVRLLQPHSPRPKLPPASTTQSS